MRNLAPALLLVLTAAASGQTAPDVRTFMISSIERIRVDGPYDVHIVTGGAPSARAEGARDAVERLAVRVDGGTMVVTAATTNGEGWRSRAGASMLVTVSVPNPLHAASVNGGGRLTIDRMKGQRVDLGVNGAGTLNVDTIEADNLAATLTGTGTMTLGGAVGHATFGSYGAGTIEASKLLARDLTVRASSSGNGNFAAQYTAQINDTGLGSITVAGRPKCTATGPGPIFCGDDNGRN